MICAAVVLKWSPVKSKTWRKNITNYQGTSASLITQLGKLYLIFWLLIIMKSLFDVALDCLCYSSEACVLKCVGLDPGQITVLRMRVAFFHIIIFIVR